MVIGTRIVRCTRCQEAFTQRNWFPEFKPVCGACLSMGAYRKHIDQARAAERAARTKRDSQARGIERARKLAAKRGERFEIVEWSPPEEERLSGGEDDQGG